MGHNNGGISASASVTNCYNTGKVSGSGNSDVGGVVGYNEDDGIVANCYFLQQGELQGIGDGADATGATVVNDLNALCNALKGDTTTWSIHPVLGRPVLNENKEGGDGLPDSPYEISTADQLKTFRDLVNTGSEKSAHAKLMNDINLNGNEKNQWTRIGNDAHQYIGTFDGNGKTISGLYIKSSDNDQGLFGYVDTGGTVKDLTVSGTVSGNNFVGGVVGYNSGTFENCAFTGSVSGDWYVGGIVGLNDSGATVSNCYNTGEVSSNSVGGVVGENRGSVINCYNTGSVSGDQVGGVVGYNNRGSVTGCYFLQQNDVPEQGFGEGSGDATAKDNTAFHSGEVAYLLQSKQADGSGQVWGQTLGGEEDSLPTLVALNPGAAQPVYKVTFKYGYDSASADEISYSNGSVKFPAFERTGHTLTGWQNEDGQAVTEPITVTADTTFTAQWTPHTYSITASPSTLNFGSITEGEERPAAQTVTVKNTGNQTVTLKQPTATNFEIAKIDELTLNAGESVTLTIQPKDKLPRGSYSEQITISGNDGASATLTASFTVKEPPYTGKYSYEISTDIGDNGALSVDRYATEGDKVTIDVTPDQAYKLDDLSVTANGKDVELTANSDGTYSFTMPSADVKITATFAEDPDWTPDEPEEPTTDVSDLFIDIAPDAWYKDAVQYAYDNGLMTGVSATEFAPEQTTTRAMIVSILARLEGVTTAEAAGFADVNDNDWYATAVNWAANVGVVNGYEDNTFQPNTAITREQLAAILMNYAAYKGEDVSNRADLGNYTDQPSTWAEEAMQWAVAEGLISGVTNTELQPQGNATRAQVAAILQRFLEA